MKFSWMPTPHHKNVFFSENMLLIPLFFQKWSFFDISCKPVGTPHRKTANGNAIPVSDTLTAPGFRRSLTGGPSESGQKLSTFCKKLTKICQNWQKICQNRKKFVKIGKNLPKSKKKLTLDKKVCQKCQNFRKFEFLWHAVTVPV